MVGSVAAKEFVGFLAIYKQLVDIDSILLAPDKAGVPSDASVLYALVYALLDRADAKSFEAIVTYMGRVPQDFAYLFFDEVKKEKVALMKSKTFVTWALKHPEYSN
jgi:hypothetical protein